ncbi:TetR/AcrR family transcriptional regulator [Microtetraspora sp. AC03309]|uniref:TetR/AcrR family transcriptional regulator n=1 Tax=Microtetraspora sp. AC03309 TaxID=2779376 RepID=UPI001E4430A3|nr:TetR/AcrR family transcriptional regulator [Microtetraspora sp. AC03309]MCC5581574.1 TetR/AcrR family transcriptional regulator [Microtetraspora sp. AC03309]
MPGKNPLLRSDAQRNRDAVLATAMRLLGQKPEASIQEIADASGVGRTTVYRHFPSREDLVRALFAMVVDEQRAVAAAAIAEGDTAAAILRRLGPEIVGIGERYRFLDTHRDLVIDDPLKHPSPAESLLAWLVAAHGRGEIRTDLPPDWSYAMIRALAVGANEEVVAGRRSPEEAGRLLGDTLVRAFTT